LISEANHCKIAEIKNYYFYLYIVTATFTLIDELTTIHFAKNVGNHHENNHIEYFVHRSHLLNKSVTITKLSTPKEHTF
jgi:hypothetical protein